MRNYPATVHGALLSGSRESARIADFYLGKLDQADLHGLWRHNTTYTRVMWCHDMNLYRVWRHNTAISKPPSCLKRSFWEMFEYLQSFIYCVYMFLLVKKCLLLENCEVWLTVEDFFILLHIFKFTFVNNQKMKPC